MRTYIAITSTRYARLVSKVRTLSFRSHLCQTAKPSLAHLNTSYRHFFLFVNEVSSLRACILTALTMPPPFPPLCLHVHAPLIQLVLYYNRCAPYLRNPTTFTLRCSHFSLHLRVSIHILSSTWWTRRSLPRSTSSTTRSSPKTRHDEGAING